MRRLYIEHGLLDGSVSIDVFAPHVDVVEGRMSGQPSFRGTRVPLDCLLENMDDMTPDEFLDRFETVDRADLEAVLTILCGEG